MRAFQQGLADGRERVVPDFLPLEGLLHRFLGYVIPDANVTLDDPLGLIELRKEVSPDLMIADDDVSPPEPADPDVAVGEVLLRVSAKEDESSIPDLPAPDEIKTPENAIDRFIGFDRGEAACRLCQGKETPDRLLVDLVGCVWPGDTVPFDALLEVFPELVGKHLACGVTDAGVIPPVIGDRDAALLNENGKNVLPIDLVGLNDRVDAEPGGYAVCKDFDCVVPEIDAGDGVVPVSDTKNNRTTGGIGEGGEEFVDSAERDGAYLRV